MILLFCLLKLMCLRFEWRKPHNFDYDRIKTLKFFVFFPHKCSNNGWCCVVFVSFLISFVSSENPKNKIIFTMEIIASNWFLLRMLMFSSKPFRHFDKNNLCNQIGTDPHWMIVSVGKSNSIQITVSINWEKYFFFCFVESLQMIQWMIEIIFLFYFVYWLSGKIPWNLFHDKNFYFSFSFLRRVDTTIES